MKKQNEKYIEHSEKLKKIESIEIRIFFSSLAYALLKGKPSENESVFFLHSGSFYFHIILI